MKKTSLSFLALLAVVLAPTGAAPAGTKPPWCSVDPLPQAATSWPLLFTAVAELQQQDCGQPGCVTRHPGLGYCSALGAIQYDWEQSAMITEYSPCLPLVKPDGGSEGPCSYHFLAGDVYYVYRDQEMVVGVPKTAQPSCCKIAGFPMLSPSFPFYVEQFARQCRGYEPRDVRMFAQIMRWIPTPGDPPGFYGYYPQVTQTAEGTGDPIAISTWATPYGFGGGTPGGFSQVSYRSFNVNPGVQPSYEVPELCRSAPDCTMVNPVAPAPPGGIIPVSAFLQCLAPVRAGGCSLCHTAQTQPVFSGPLPCCPNEVWNGSACVAAKPGELPPEVASCLHQLSGSAPAAGTSAPRLLPGH